MIDVNWLLIILFGALSVIDGVLRVRGRSTSTVLAVLEIVLGAFVLLITFVASFPLAAYLSWLALALEVVLVIVLVTRGSGRRRGWLGLTAVAALAGLFVVLRLFGIFDLGAAF